MGEEVQQAKGRNGKTLGWGEWGGDKDLAGWIRYHYNCCDVKEGGGFP